MAQVILKYNGSEELDWAECSHLNDVTGAAMEVTKQDETVVLLRQFYTQSEAEEKREELLEQISNGLESEGGTEYVIIDDL